jgi:hypothetical protein
VEGCGTGPFAREFDERNAWWEVLWSLCMEEDIYNHEEDVLVEGYVW